MRALIMVALTSIVLNACREENLETADFNAFFYYPENSREEYLGLVRPVRLSDRSFTEGAFLKHESWLRLVLHML